MDNQNWITEAAQRQKEFSDIFAQWRIIDREHMAYTKSTIGLFLFGTLQIENPPPVVNYYQVYNEEIQGIIDGIYRHVLEICADQIFLSCTYLIMNIENQNIPYAVLRYCRSPSDQIYFTETTGRYYQGWQDLLSCIQLPPCNFIAPSNGLYTSSTLTCMEYISPAASSGQIIMRTANAIALGGTVVCTTASMFAAAPAIVGFLGTGLTLFGVKQSISVLLDRWYHGQSISLDNREAILSYGNIVSSGLSAASIATLRYFERLQSSLGNYANATVTALNVTTVLFDSGFLLINVYDFVSRLRQGTVTPQDVFELSLQVFLVCGAVIQTREMHRLLNQSSASPSGTLNRKLTKTQKRNLQRRRAKARARGENPQMISSRSTEHTITVGECDLYSSMKMFATKIATLGVNVMMAMYPRAEIILSEFLDLLDLIRSFVDGQIEMKEFFQQIFYHARNLYTIIRQDIEAVQEILRNFFADPLINDNEMVAQVVNNELDRINEIAEEVMPAPDELEISENIERLETSENVEQNENESLPMTDSNCQIILNYIHDICSDRRMKEPNADAQISFFHVILVFTTDYLNKNSVQLFEETFKSSSAIVGEEKATMMTSTLGRKIGNDFYPTTIFVEKVLDNSKAAVLEFMELIGVEFEEGACSSLAQKIFGQYRRLLYSMYERINEQNQIGVNRMTCLLDELSSTLEEKLCAECRKISFDSHRLYEENIGILGKSITDEMMKTIDMPTTELEFFRYSLKFIKTDDIVSEMKIKYNINIDEFIEPAYSISTTEENNSDENINEVIINVIKKLYEKIDGCPESTLHFNSREFESKSELFKAITLFIAEKFITELKLVSQELESRKNLIRFMETIRSFASEKYAVFKKIARSMENERNLENMVAEFANFYRHSRVRLQQPKIFDTTIGDDGFITYKISCDQKGSDESYKQLVCSLFEIRIDDFDCNIVRGDRGVLIKSKDKAFTFSFPAEENVALVIYTNLAKTPDDPAHGSNKF